MINSRGKRVVREAVFLTTFVFVRVEDKNLNEIRFRSDVYKMLSEPGKSAPYAIPDTNSTISASESLKRRLQLLSSKG